MSVLSIAQVKTYTDHISRTYQELLTLCGLSTGAIVAGTLRDIANQLLSVTTGSGAYDIENDLNDDLDNLLVTIPADQLYQRNWYRTIGTLNDHLGSHGSEITASISSLDTMLQYYNGGAGGIKFANLVDPYFSDLYNILLQTRLTQYGVYGKGIHPDLNASYTIGMGTKDTAGVFTAGQAYDSNYSEFVPVVEVITDFAGGGAFPQVHIAGTDDGGLLTTTWDVTLDANNPTAAISTTITPIVSIMARQTVALASTSGIVQGSVLTVNSGLIDAEVIVVESVGGGSITAVFRKAHLAGAAITGKRSYVTTPSVANARLRTISGITLTLSGHAAGKVRISGRQDRVAI